MNDYVKLPAILIGYLVVAPLLGHFLAGKRAWQRLLVGLMVFMTSWHINKLTLMLMSVETYRGHTKGFEFSLLQILSIALLWARRREAPADFRWLPPGAWLWALQCCLCSLSVFSAPNSSYALMALWKFASATVIMAAAYHMVRDGEDLRLLLRAVTVTLVVQVIVVLKLKYVDGHYQVRGWFEHQNPLAMWSYLLGLPLFAAALGPGDKVETRWQLAGFIASAILLQCTLSRAAMALFAGGVCAISLLSLADGINLKRVRILFGIGFIGLLGLAATIGTIIARFHDEGNTASKETRELLNIASRAMLRENFFGVGWNNYGITINHPYRYGDVIDDWTRDRGHAVNYDEPKGLSESLYWLLFAENGYLGAGSCILFLVVTGWWAARGAIAGRGTIIGAFLLGLFVALALTYAHCTLERVLTQTKNLAAWLLLLGVVARMETLRLCKTTPQPPRPPAAARGLPPAPSSPSSRRSSSPGSSPAAGSSSTTTRRKPWLRSRSKAAPSNG
jgi:hypothetical protein